MAGRICKCFIGGTGRSGTTILKRILKKHNSCIGIPEYRFSIDPDGLISFLNINKSNWSPYVYHKSHQRLFNLLSNLGYGGKLSKLFSYSYRKLKLDNVISYNIFPQYFGSTISKYSPNYSKLLRNLNSELSKFSYNGNWNGSGFLEKNHIYFQSNQNIVDVEKALSKFWNDFINDVCSKYKSTHFIDDNPWNILYIKEIQELIPDLKFVHVIRDPRDVVASYLGVRWAPNKIDDAIDWYSSIMNKWLFNKSTLAEDFFLEIKLENLVKDPNSVIQSICDHFLIPWDDVLLTQKLNRSNTGRWVNQFSSQEKAILNKKLKPFLDLYEYN